MQDRLKGTVKHKNQACEELMIFTISDLGTFRWCNSIWWQKCWLYFTTVLRSYLKDMLGLQGKSDGCMKDEMPSGSKNAGFTYEISSGNKSVGATE